MTPQSDRHDRPSTVHAPRLHYHRHASEHPHHQPSRDHTQDTANHVPRSFTHSQARLFSIPVSAPNSRPPTRPSTPVHASYSISRRHSWPPTPSVEDEDHSRAREAWPPVVMDPAVSEVKVRGLQEQQPILVDADMPVDKIAATSTQQLGHDGRPIDTQPAQGVANQHRRSTPYAQTNLSHSDGERESRKRDSGYASRDLKKSGADESIPSNALRGPGKSRRSISRGSYKDSPLQNADRESYNKAQSDGAQPNVRSTAKAPSSERNERELCEPVTSAARVKGQSLHHARRSTSDGVPAPLVRPHLELRRETALGGGGVVVDSSQFVSSPTSTTFHGDLSASRHSSAGHSSRPSTPDEKSHRRGASSPSHSPRIGSARPSAEDSPRSVASSRSSSRTGSRSSSPQPTVQLPTRAHFRSDARTQRSSKLMSSMTPSTANLREEPSSLQARHEPVSPMRPGTSLPYPVDDMALMPSEDDHRYRPRALEGAVMSVATAATAAATSAAHNQKSIGGRPQISRTQSHDVSLPRLNTENHPTALSQSPIIPTSAKPGAVQPCPVAQPIKGYNDWWTLQDCPRFNICRSCIDANFTDTTNQRHFHRTSRGPDKRVQCDFASPWARLAWRLDRKRDRGDLRYLHAIAAIMVAEVPCPGAHEDRMTWYTVADDDGRQVEKFNICSTDLKMVKTLLPHTRDMFEKNHESAGRPRRCDFDVDSKRFTSYLSSLTEVENGYRAGEREHEHAKHRFYQKALSNTQVRECAGDRLLADARWHFMPTLPDFTVCDECYSAVVWPQIAKDSRVALNFNRTPTRVHSRRSSTSSANGAQDLQSCQLYSERMRRQFDRACRDNDFAWLERKAKERKQVELEIAEERAGLLAEEKALKREGHGERQLAGIRSRLAKLDADWQKWE